MNPVPSFADRYSRGRNSTSVSEIKRRVEGISMATNYFKDRYTEIKSWLEQLKILLAWLKIAGMVSRLAPVPIV